MERNKTSLHLSMPPIPTLASADISTPLTLTQMQTPSGLFTPLVLPVMFRQTPGGPLNSTPFRLQDPPEFSFNEDVIITEHLPTEAEEVKNEYLNIQSELPAEIIIPPKPPNGHASSDNVAIKRPMPPPVDMVSMVKLLNRYCSNFAFQLWVTLLDWEVSKERI